MAATGAEVGRPDPTVGRLRMTLEGNSPEGDM